MENGTVRISRGSCSIPGAQRTKLQTTMLAEEVGERGVLASEAGALNGLFLGGHALLQAFFGPPSF